MASRRFKKTPRSAQWARPNGVRLGRCDRQGMPGGAGAAPPVICQGRPPAHGQRFVTCAKCLVCVATARRNLARRMRPQVKAEFVALSAGMRQAGGRPSRPQVQSEECVACNMFTQLKADLACLASMSGPPFADEEVGGLQRSGRVRWPGVVRVDAAIRRLARAFGGGGG
jgi:hypothetical protein